MRKPDFGRKPSWERVGKSISPPEEGRDATCCSRFPVYCPMPEEKNGDSQIYLRSLFILALVRPPERVGKRVWEAELADSFVSGRAGFGALHRGFERRESNGKELSLRRVSPLSFSPSGAEASVSGPARRAQRSPNRNSSQSFGQRISRRALLASGRKRPYPWALDWGEKIIMNNLGNESEARGSH